jgi:GNAT superfamily N-acetyltransferase
MEILPASLRDLGALRHIEKACFPKDAWPLLDLIAVLTWPDVVRLKAVEGNQMIGFIAGDPRPSEQIAWIASVGVLPEFQQRGIGRMRETAHPAAHPPVRARFQPGSHPSLPAGRLPGDGYLAGILQRQGKRAGDGKDPLNREK